MSGQSRSCSLVKYSGLRWRARTHRQCWRRKAATSVALNRLPPGRLSRLVARRGGVLRNGREGEKNAKRKKNSDASEVEHPSNASLTLLSSLLRPPSDSVLFVSPAPTTQTKSGDDSFHWLFFFFYPSNRWCSLPHPPHQRLRRFTLVIALQFQGFFSLFSFPVCSWNVPSRPEPSAPAAAFGVFVFFRRTRNIGRLWLLLHNTYVLTRETSYKGKKKINK